MSKQISFEEIRKGDRISVYVEYEQKGIKYCRSSVGVAHALTGDVWRTVDGGHLVSPTHEMTHMIVLLGRTKPPLPTTPLPQFVATEVRGAKGCWEMSVEVGGLYVEINGNPIARYYYHEADDITAWEPIEGDKNNG